MLCWLQFCWPSEATFGQIGFRSAGKRRWFHVTNQTIPYVLPFKNLSGDSTKAFIAEGIAENITNQISRSSEVFVISNTSAKKVAEKGLDSSAIADAVGVRYLVSGSIQEANGNLRVNVELIDAIENRIVWVDKFSGKTKQLFEFQDHITNSVFENLQINFASKLGGMTNNSSHWTRSKRRFWIRPKAF